MVKTCKALSELEKWTKKMSETAEEEEDPKAI